jgi:hypothetical protein
MTRPRLTQYFIRDTRQNLFYTRRFIEEDVHQWLTTREIVNQKKEAINEPKNNRHLSADSLGVARLTMCPCPYTSAS